MNTNQKTGGEIIDLRDMNTERPESSGSLVAVEQSRAVQEVQAALVIAKKFPRDERGAYDKIMNACQRPSLANASIYSYARGGSEITGPSIRLAEALAQYWGNIESGWRELERKAGVSTVQAYAWDMQTNTRKSLVFEVKHIRNTKKQSYVLTDERDIYENMANNASRRLRACILSLIPADVIEDAVDQCEETMKIKEQPTPERIKAMVEFFASYGVSKEAIEKRIQRNIESITAAQLVSLRKIVNSIKDGMSKPEDWFEFDVAAKSEAPSAQDKPKTLEELKQQQTQENKE